jgi:hypothetical protein
VTHHDAFWIDEEYDREHAEAGTSRYGTVVERNAGDFADSWGDIAPVGFACAAWRLATTPVLDPGYVRFHRRVLTADCRRNTWDGTLVAQVTMVAPWPEPLSRSRTWWRDRGWRNWPQTFGQFLVPSDRELSKTPHARGLLVLDTPIPLDQFPPVPDEPSADLQELAQRTVAVLARELNDLLVPMLRQLDE